jgi:hypothetical protein
VRTTTIISHLVASVPTRHIRRFPLTEIALMTISFFCPFRFGRWGHQPIEIDFVSVGEITTIISHLVASVLTRHIRRFPLTEIALMTISFFCPFRFGRWGHQPIEIDFVSVGEITTIISHLVASVPTRHIWCYLLTEIALMTISFFCRFRFGRWGQQPSSLI